MPKTDFTIVLLQYQRFFFDVSRLLDTTNVGCGANTILGHFVECKELSSDDVGMARDTAFQ